MQNRQKQQMSSTHINIMTFFIAKGKKKKGRKKDYQKDEVLSGETEINLCLSHSSTCQIKLWALG